MNRLTRTFDAAAAVAVRRRRAHRLTTDKRAAAAAEGECARSDGRTAIAAARRWRRLFYNLLQRMLDSNPNRSELTQSFCRQREEGNSN